jgi:hypothetical protein
LSTSSTLTSKVALRGWFKSIEKRFTSLLSRPSNEIRGF